MENKNDSLTRLMLHFDGADGADTIVDSAVGGSSAKIFTNGGVLADESVWKGTTALRCYGVGNSLKVHPHPDFQFGSSTWTVDGRFHVRSPNAPHLFCWWRDADNYFGLVHTRTIGNIAWYLLRLKIAGQVIAESFIDRPIPLIGSYHHVAIMRNGSAVTTWWDGTLHPLSMLLPSATYPLNLHRWPLLIGRGVRFGRPDLGDLDGFVDEFRVHNGPLLSSNGVLASTTYDLPTEQYPRAVRKLVAGSQNVRRRVGKIARGNQNIGLLPRRKRVQGVQNVRRAIVQRVAGSQQVRRATKVRVSGKHSIGLTTAPTPRMYRKRVMGAHAVLRLVAKRVSTTQNIGLTTRKKRVQGVQDVRRAATKGVLGVQTVRKTYGKRIIGQQAVSKTAVRYEIYYAFGGEPDFSADPWATTGSLPFETAAITGEGRHYFVVRERSADGVLSQNRTAWVVELDGSDNEISPAPRTPRDVTVDAAAAGAYRVTARYEYGRDGIDAADSWLVYARTDGSDPDPGVDSPIVLPVRRADGIARLSYLSASGPGGETVKVIVGVRQDGGRDTLAPIVATTSSVSGPTAPTLAVIHRVGRRRLRIAGV